jgi:hypothetical protein
MKQYSFRSRSRKNLIKEANEGSLFSTIPQAQDIVSKRHLVSKSNPLFYAFGEKLLPINGLAYDEWLNRIYIGRSR